ncbi:hypothetical protein FB45DRAFT_868237 [Roridomyces roridus]|uniref:Uncharacterized protein n=1 Tax=Roridomyces roridus TaxID=1738132 RepID=A0AAD7BPE8_9AGAR|nr:hypothetical protein FB45DRAFT_868237 [Roridomyces roridus]
MQSVLRDCIPPTSTPARAQAQDTQSSWDDVCTWYGDYWVLRMATLLDLEFLVPSRGGGRRSKAEKHGMNMNRTRSTLHEQGIRPKAARKSRGFSTRPRASTFDIRERNSTIPPTRTIFRVLGESSILKAVLIELVSRTVSRFECMEIEMRARAGVWTVGANAMAGKFLPRNAEEKRNQKLLIIRRQDIPPLRSGNFKSIPGTTAKQSHAISTYTQEENSSRTRARGITLNMPSGAHDQTAYGSLPAHARRGYCMGRSASSFVCQQSSNLRMVPVATLARYEAGISEFASSNSRVWFDGFDFWSTASSGRMDW